MSEEPKSLKCPACEHEYWTKFTDDETNEEKIICRECELVIVWREDYYKIKVFLT